MTLKKCTSCNGTGHDKPETAEERVRAWTADASAGRETDWLAPADLRAILAELDRVRETSEALRASLRASNAVAQHVQGERDGLVKDLDQLRAQRPADVEKDRVAAEYCRIATDVMEKAFDCQVTADCFCHESWQRTLFSHSEQVIGFVRDAVAEKIGRGE